MFGNLTLAALDNGPIVLAAQCFIAVVGLSIVGFVVYTGALNGCGTNGLHR